MFILSHLLYLTLLKKKVLSLSKRNSRRLLSKALVLIKVDEVGSFSFALLQRRLDDLHLLCVCLVAHESKTLQKATF